MAPNGLSHPVRKRQDDEDDEDACPVLYPVDCDDGVCCPSWNTCEVSEDETRCVNPFWPGTAQPTAAADSTTSSGSSTTPTPTSTSTSTSTPTATTTATASSKPQSHLEPGEIAGAAVGGTLGGILLILFIITTCMWYHRRKSTTNRRDRGRSSSDPLAAGPGRDDDDACSDPSLFHPPNNHNNHNNNYNNDYNNPGRVESVLLPPATSQLQSVHDPAAWREQYSAASPRELEGREIVQLPSSPSDFEGHGAAARGSVAGVSNVSSSSAGSRATATASSLFYGGRPESVEVSPGSEGEDGWRTAMSEVPRRKSLPKTARLPSEYIAELPE